MITTSEERSLRELKTCGRYFWVVNVKSQEKRRALEVMRKLQDWPPSTTEYEILQKYFDLYLWDKMLGRLQKIKNSRKDTSLCLKPAFRDLF